MPTIKIEPKYGSPSGYRKSDERSFTDEQVAELAELAAIADPEAIREPLQEAAGAIGRFQYTLDVPTPGEQRAALERALNEADALYATLTALTPTDRRSLREQYAGGQFDDPEHLRGGEQKVKAPPLLAEDMSPIAVAARSTEANAKLNADIDTVARLRENLGVAFKLTKVRSGRPKDRLGSFAEEKLGEIYNRFAAVASRRSHGRELFIQAALGMLKILPSLDG